MAKGGVLTQNISCTMHTGTHCDVPRHVMEKEFDGLRSRYLHEFPVDAFCGDAVCLDLHFVKRWELIEDEQLDQACRNMGIDPDSDYLEGKGVILCTGMNLKFDDSKEYYHYSCGTGVRAGKWFVRHKVKFVGLDLHALDHPLHTAMGNNGMTRMNLLGASGRLITEEYIEEFGEEAYAKFDKETYIKLFGKEAYMEEYGDLEAINCWGTWEPCHKELLGHGIVGIENVGGDLEKVCGKEFEFFCLPLRWYMGDGCMVRCAARIDEDQLNDVPERTYMYCGTGAQDRKNYGFTCE